jgi:diketogulonate reductase-like aldo/keto reductase
MPVPSPTDVVLRGEVRLPRVGLGVFRMPSGAATRLLVKEALAVGFRHIDTARVYGNEEDVADGIRDSGLPRDQVFVTTKLWNDDQGYDSTLRAFDAALKRMRLDTIDLYLLHWPVPGKRKESWRALERLRAEGRVRAIGVSNFMEHHLEELLGYAHELPSVNQIEVSPFLQQRGVRSLCDRHGIVVEAYSPLTKGARLSHPEVQRVAKNVGRTPAQVLLAWGLHHGLVVLPKSSQPARLAENLAAIDVELGADDMVALDALEEGLVTGWDPRKAS